jgi:hypothetical protein
LIGAERSEALAAAGWGPRGAGRGCGPGPQPKNADTTTLITRLSEGFH